MLDGGIKLDGHYEMSPDMEEYDRSSNYEHHDSKRKRTRSRDRGRKHRHSSGTRRRHKRSRSRKRGRDKTPARVHINPNFSNLGPTATSLLETNNFLEAEVVHLRNELSCTSIRIRALENELSNGTATRGNLEKALSVSRLNQQKWQQTAAKNSQIISSLRKEAGVIRKAKEELMKLQKQTEMQLAANTEQVTFLTKRNEVLGKKCEELVEKNRICREERDDALKMVNSMKREVENMQATADLRLIDYRRMESDLSTAREKERMWKVEKIELERKLSAKESLTASERRRVEEQRKRERAQLEQLQNKLKCEQPGWDVQLGVEAVFRAIESIKREFGGQLEQLSNQITGGRPPRVLSAPPSSDLCVPSSSKSETAVQSLSEQFASALASDVIPCPQIEALTNLAKQKLSDSYDGVETSKCCVGLMKIEEGALVRE